jgi:hypothetical protein
MSSFLVSRGGDVEGTQRGSKPRREVDRAQPDRIAPQAGRPPADGPRRRHTQRAAGSQRGSLQRRVGRRRCRADRGRSHHRRCICDRAQVADGLGPREEAPFASVEEPFLHVKGDLRMVLGEVGFIFVLAFASELGQLFLGRRKQLLVLGVGVCILQQEREMGCPCCRISSMRSR